MLVCNLEDFFLNIIGLEPALFPIINCGSHSASCVDHSESSVKPSWFCCSCSSENQAQTSHICATLTDLSKQSWVDSYELPVSFAICPVITHWSGVASVHTWATLSQFFDVAGLPLHSISYSDSWPGYSSVNICNWLSVNLKILKRRGHKFSRNVGATSIFCMSEGWCKASSMLCPWLGVNILLPSTSVHMLWWRHVTLLIREFLFHSLPYLS